MAAGFAVLGVGLLVLAAASDQLVFLLGWLLMGLGTGACLYDAAFGSLGKLFGASARPAIATVTLWGGFASTICWPLSAALLPTLGWRGICVMYGLIQFAISVPLVIWSLRGKVRPVPRLDAKEALLEASERPVYYLLMATFVITALSMSVIYIHLIELLQARGVELAAAVALGALIGPSQVAARALDMVFGRKHHPVWAFLASLAGCATGLWLFAFGFPYLSISIIVFAAGNGVFSIVRGTLPLVLFGPEKFPTIIGMLARPGFIAFAFAPSVGAVMIETAGARHTIEILALAMICNLGLGVALSALVRRRT